MAASAQPTDDSRSTDAVGSPGRSSTLSPPHTAISAPIRQNRRVRINSSRSSASSGEPIVVEPPAAVAGYGVCGRGRRSVFGGPGAALVDVAVSRSSLGKTDVTSLGFAGSFTDPE